MCKASVTLERRIPSIVAHIFMRDFNLFAIEAVMAQQKPSPQTNVDLVNGVGQCGVGDLREKTMEKTQKQPADGGPVGEEACQGAGFHTAP